MRLIKTATKFFLIYLLLLSIAVIWLGISYTKDITLPSNVQGKHIDVDGVQLRVLQTGQGPDVLFLHASIGSIEDFEAVLPLLKDYRVTMFDRIGHGYSDLPPVKTNIENNARYASALIKKLQLHDVIVVGHSYGGSVALKMALAHDPNIKSLVLLAPAAYPLHRTKPVEHLLAKPVIGLGLIRLLYTFVAEDMLTTGLLASLTADNRVIPDDFISSRVTLWNNPGILYTRTQQTDDIIAELEQMSWHYKNLQLPVSIILGTDEPHQDIIDDCVLLAKDLPQGKLIPMKGGDHYLQYRDPPLIRDIIVQHSQHTVRTH